MRSLRRKPTVSEEHKPTLMGEWIDGYSTACGVCALIAEFTGDGIVTSAEQETLTREQVRAMFHAAAKIMREESARAVLVGVRGAEVGQGIRRRMSGDSEREH
jgi:hypothetical protein